MSTTVSPIGTTPDLQSVTSSSQTRTNPSSQTAASAGDTVTLSTNAQTVLTGAETVMEDTMTNSQIIQAADGGDPVAQALLAAEAAIAGQG